MARTIASANYLWFPIACAVANTSARVRSASTSRTVARTPLLCSPAACTAGFVIPDLCLSHGNMGKCRSTRKVSRLRLGYCAVNSPLDI